MSQLNVGLTNTRRPFLVIYNFIYLQSFHLEIIKKKKKKERKKETKHGRETKMSDDVYFEAEVLKVKTQIVFFS